MGVGERVLGVRLFFLSKKTPFTVELSREGCGTLSPMVSCPCKVELSLSL